MALNEDLKKCQISEEEAANAKSRALAIKEVANEKFKGLYALYKFTLMYLKYCFLEENYEQAISLYTQCIELDSKEPIYFSNRSMSYLKKELYGLALEDANTSLSINPAFVKGFFRRAAANLALGMSNMGVVWIVN